MQDFEKEICSHFVEMENRSKKANKMGASLGQFFFTKVFSCIGYLYVSVALHWVIILPSDLAPSDYFLLPNQKNKQQKRACFEAVSSRYQTIVVYVQLWLYLKGNVAGIVSEKV